MDDIYKHFRKFTKVKIEGSEDWQFFRFWDPQTAAPYFGTMKDDASRIQQWFGGCSITLNSIVAEQEAGKKAISFVPCAELDLSSNRPTGMLVLTPDELVPFTEIQAEKDIVLIVELLRKSFSKELNHMSDDLLNREVHKSVTRMQEYGIHRKENLFITSAWAAFFGGEFETKDPQGQMEKICRSNLPESEKMKKLKSRIADLKTKEPTT